ncbi:MAG: hypothetical protein WCX95_01310 [Candidatus Gracilibacteria bacterium]
MGKRTFISIALVLAIGSTLLATNFNKEIQADISSTNPSSTINIDNFKTALKSIRPIVPQKTQDNILAYIQNSQSEELKKAFNLLLEKDLDTKLSKAKRTISGLTIDGNISDWQSSGLIQTDKENDSVAINKNSSTGESYQTDDVKSYAFIMDNNNIYAMIEPSEMPTDWDEYHFRINISNHSNKKIYAIVWLPSTNVIQEWNTETGEYIGKIDMPTAQFAKGETGFEAKIPIAQLTRLPYSFRAEAVSWQKDRNFYDECNKLFYEQSIYEKYKKSALELLTKYAATTTLTADDPFPAVQAISDSYIYKRADSSTKKSVISDGIEMIKKAKETETYSFPDQKKLKDLPVEALLAWADRSMMYAGYVFMEFFPTNGEKLNQKTYEFTVLQPETLDTCESLIEKNNLIDQTNLKNTIHNIEPWLVKTEKYRRNDIKDMERNLKFNPDSKYWQNAYQESLNEIANGETNITTINGVNINKGANFSPSFQLDYLTKNGFYYGNCVDVTVMAMTCYKALGIPAFQISYGITANNYYAESHSFPVYYSSKDDKWYTYELGGNPVQEKTLPTSGSYNVLYRINRPQTNSYWEPYLTELKNANIWTNTRAATKEISEKDWNTINKDGYSMADFKKILFTSVK